MIDVIVTVASTINDVEEPTYVTTKVYRFEFEDVADVQSVLAWAREKAVADEQLVARQ